MAWPVVNNLAVPRLLAFTCCVVTMLPSPMVIAASTYRSRILQDNPIGYWGLDEVSGTVATNLGSLGSAANGTYFGADIQGDVGTGFSDLGSAIRLDAGIGESGVTVDLPLLNNLAGFTISGWINPAASESSNRTGLFGQNDAVEFGFIGPNTIQIWTPNGGSSNVAYTRPNNEWHHIAAVGNGVTGELLVFIDGQRITPDSTSATTTANFGVSEFPFNIGGGPIFGEDGQFVGAIDEVAVFNRALPAETIGDHYLSAFGLPAALQISRVTGEATIVGRDEDSIQVNAYQITSEANSLRSERFISLGSQGLDVVDGPGDADGVPGNSPGESWEVIEASNSSILEAFLFGSTTVSPAVGLSLGRLLDPSVGTDTTLQFSYSTASGEVRLGSVKFVRGSGDYNDDGVVDTADFGVWQQFFGTTGVFPDSGINPDGNGDGLVDAADYSVWRDHLTEGVSPVALRVGQVPEPASIAVLGVAGVALSLGRRLRRSSP